MKNKVRIENRKVKFEYFIKETFCAGIQLTGVEVKRIRDGKVSLIDSFCYFNNGELFTKGITIQGIGNDNVGRDRKLLLKKRELRKIQDELVKGYTIVPYVMYENDKGLLKIDIVLCKGKKLYDKRESIKEKEINLEIMRNFK